jgi:type IV pilus assembly protein PilN
MIRINLLPQAKKPARAPTPPSGSGAAWAVFYAVAVVVWCVGLGVVYFVYQGDLEEQQQKNRALKQRIETLEEKSEGLDKLKAKLARSKKLEKVVDRLNKKRKGPTRVLDELSAILSEGQGPSIDPEELKELRQDNPLAGYNRSWDVRRLWLTTFKEDDRNCRMRGKGKTNEDVAEFLRRLDLSEHFESVTLTRTQMTKVNELEFIGFELTCKVKY